MGSVPHDVLLEILKWLIVPGQDEISKPGTQWPFEVLYDVPLRGSHAEVHLRACSLVCRWWRVVAQPILQEHLYWSSSTGKIAAENLLKIDGVASKVTNIETGRTYCTRCSLGEPCGCDISIETVVSTVAACPRLTRLVVSTWDGLDVIPSLPLSPIRTFPQLTTFRIGYSQDSSRIPLRTFCLILQLMPALRTLSIGDISNASSDEIDDIPYPPCQLRSFAVSDARGVNFQSYDWLLHNSKDSLQMLYTYCCISPDSVASLIRALCHLGPSLKDFRCLGCWDEQVLLSALQHCHKLEALTCCNSPDVLEDLANAPCAKTLQRFTATKVTLTRSRAYLNGADPSGDPEEHVIEFWSSGELVTMRGVVQARTLPQLKEWKLHTWAKERLVHVPVNELVALRNECDTNGVVFDFARYDEVTKGHKQ